MIPMETSGVPRLRSSNNSLSGDEDSNSGRTPRSSQAYTKISASTDDDHESSLEDIPVPVMHSAYSSSNSSNSCAKCGFVFSLAGIVFLSSIALMLRADSIYIKVSAENDKKKVQLSEGVMGAVYMYVFCFIISSYYLFKKGAVRYRVDDSTTL